MITWVPIILACAAIGIAVLCFWRLPKVNLAHYKSGLADGYEQGLRDGRLEVKRILHDADRTSVPRDDSAGSARITQARITQI